MPLLSPSQLHRRPHIGKVPARDLVVADRARFLRKCAVAQLRTTRPAFNGNRKFPKMDAALPC